MGEIDRILNTDQDNEISVQRQKSQAGTIRKNDQLAHAPNDASKKHSLDDEQELLPSDNNALGEAAEDAFKK
jgi:hypothetical protein